ncbi:glycosyltransferase family 2 protein [Hanstruepera ponticola]|uniref:glycosyltransferase family 2 protein n=1 Tax=Hanstruepera ponticola TaxID=2042995 RepID=UPI000CF11061|nr:glycosyltransferase family 2 protein [Hanstruepera ponticola]
MPKFSIVIPLYNKAKYIAKTLNRVLNQTFSDFEIIIVNDGSTDNSFEVVEKFTDARVKLFTTKNQGVSAARNFGIKKAQGNYIAFLDADDFWEEIFLETINGLIISYPNEHIFATALKIMTSKRVYPATYKHFNLKQNETGILSYFTASIGHSILHCANSVFSKKAVENIGYFDESLKTNEDTDYWIRSGFKYNVVFVNKPLATHHFTGSGLSKTNKTTYKSIDFKKYIKQSNKQPQSKAFLNKNIYSSIIKYKLLSDRKNSNALKNIIEPKHINIKQKFVISLPPTMLKPLIYFYNLFNKEKNYY